MMTMRALSIAAGFFAASLTPALADSITAYVHEWDPANRVLTLEDKSQVANIAPTVTIPDGLKAGVQVTVDYQGDENGIVAVNSVTIIKDVAKKLPLPAKRG
jgi:hypothetical protein